MLGKQHDVAFRELVLAFRRVAQIDAATRELIDERLRDVIIAQRRANEGILLPTRRECIRHELRDSRLVLRGRVAGNARNFRRAQQTRSTRRRIRRNHAHRMRPHALDEIDRAVLLPRIECVGLF